MNGKPADRLEQPDRRSDKGKQHKDHQTARNNQHLTIRKLCSDGKHRKADRPNEKPTQGQPQQHWTNSGFENQ